MLCQEKTIVCFSYLQGCQVKRAIYTINSSAGTAIGRFDNKRIVLLGNLLEQLWMSNKVGEWHGQSMSMRKCGSYGFVTYQTDRARVIDGWDTRSFCRFQKT